MKKDANVGKERAQPEMHTRSEEIINVGFFRQWSLKPTQLYGIGEA
jgi:hypothetical protein